LSMPVSIFDELSIILSDFMTLSSTVCVISNHSKTF
jgi:hypothetical protein